MVIIAFQRWLKVVQDMTVASGSRSLELREESLGAWLQTLQQDCKD